jgi:hypothetical protein
LKRAPGPARATPGRSCERAKWSYRVAGMAQTDTDTTALAPRELVTEIERTRANLAQTIDEIADRVAPGNIARRAGERAKERVSQIDPLIGSAVALAAVGVTCYLVWRRLRR